MGKVSWGNAHSRHELAGPGTNLDKRLTSTDAYQEWSKPVDRVDNAAYHHDLAYKYFNDKQTRNLADQMMLEEMNSLQNPTQREIRERKIIEPIISTKAKFGLGVSKELKNQKFSMDSKNLKKNTDEHNSYGFAERSDLAEPKMD